MHSPAKPVDPPLMRPVRDVGVVGYGAYVPRYRLPGKEVSRVWSGGCALVPVHEKSVPGLDEDVVTMSIEAARNALARARIDLSSVGAVWVGSESHPYAVKPSSTVVAEALGIGPYTLAADWEFACKAGTEAIQGAIGLVGSGARRYALAIGMDTAQGRPGDALEYTAGAGGAAFVLGPAEESLAVLEASLSFVSDTPDFWRRQHALYPEHGGRFTGDPAYFKHVLSAARKLMDGLGTRTADYAHAVFHQPNVKFPSKAGKDLGFSPQQLERGLLANSVGNTYAGAALLGLTAILDQAAPGERILVVSFGSGAGSDAFSLRVTERIRQVPQTVPTTEQYIARRVPLDYATYARFRGKYATG
jgi:hydroxymethylglutaryl-CoA synthase